MSKPDVSLSSSLQRASLEGIVKTRTLVDWESTLSILNETCPMVKKNRSPYRTKKADQTDSEYRGYIGPFYYGRSVNVIRVLAVQSFERLLRSQSNETRILNTAKMDCLSLGDLLLLHLAQAH